MADRKRLAILGSTGSIGVSTLDVVARHPERFEVAALAARHQVDALFDQCVAFRPRLAVLLDPGAARELQRRLLQAGVGCEVRSGPAALEEVASLQEVDTVMAAIVLRLPPSPTEARPKSRIATLQPSWDDA